MPCPFIEDSAQELSIAFGRNIKMGFMWQGTLGGGIHSRRLCHIGLIAGALHYRQELDIIGHRTKEMIHFQRMMHIYRVYRSKHIILHLMLAEQFHTTHYLMESPVALRILSECIVQMLRTVQTYAYAELIVPEELAPLIV